jgi:hypothetical protein
MKTRKPRKRVPAEAIARNADQGSDVSRFFTKTGTGGPSYREAKGGILRTADTGSSS